MTTTYAAVHFIANGKPYIFSSDVTDATSDATNNFGDTFAAGATITHIGPVTLNSSDGTGASKSILGAVVTDPQNNAVAEISWVDPETAPISQMVPCSIPVGLNFALKILTTNT